MKKISVLLLLLCTCLLLANCKKNSNEAPRPTVPLPEDKYGSLLIEFAHKAGADTFGFNKNYINSSGETFKVNTLQYILSNFKLRKKDGTEITLPNTYFLVDPSVSPIIAINKVPEGVYTGISYLVGVDSATTAGGAKTGALDPVNGMYWTWQTGYINFRMVGTSPASSYSTKVFDYDVGGFIAPNQTVQFVNHDFMADTLAIRTDALPFLHINVDILEFFKSPVDISIAKVSSILDSGADAVMAAKNYKDMFSFQSIRN